MPEFQIWAAIAAAACLGYVLARPTRDFYVLERSYFNRIHEAPWRGDLHKRHHECFTDFAAAKASFDRWETVWWPVVDRPDQEPEHAIKVIAARSMVGALDKVKRKGLGLVVLQTPSETIWARRKGWKPEID